ncbi:MAG: DEAD/DEAH box helicase [Bacteroidetes bacterium CG2_30_33_31]|nr:MAG: DEAD/DEAH box helicase [Bacteroidetes bacterium CG2_30_33_31]
MTDFKTMDLLPNISKALDEMGFIEPTPIQQECIPFILNTKEDLVANAQTGTGKTAAFSLPILNQIDYESKSVQCLILSPTRELALQIKSDIDKFSKYLDKFKSVAVYGGASIENQIKGLKRGAHLVVGTPGRILDLVKRNKLIVNDIKWLILDEADEMLNMGFKEDLDSILETTPESRQTLLFSATIPKEIMRIANNYMRKPHEISVGKKNQGADNVEHFFYLVNARDKYAALKRIVDVAPLVYGIVFCRTRRETQEISEKLIKDGYNTDSLHGDLSQAQRDNVMNRFRSKTLQLLVATDVAARGLDVNELTHVINFSLPDDPEVYVHRSGRTGRAGKEGVSVSIIHSREKGKVRDIERILGKKITYAEVPNGKQICEKQLFNLITKMENVEVNNDQIDSFMDVIYAKLEVLSREDIIKKFVSLEFNRFLEYYKNAQDINLNNYPERDRRDRGERRERGDRPERGSRGERSEREDRGSRSENRRGNNGTNFKRIFINIGSKDSVRPNELIGIVNENNPQLSIEVGKIDILKSFSFFEVDEKYADDMIKSFEGKEFKGRPIVSEIAESKGRQESSRSFERKPRTTYGNEGGGSYKGKSERSSSRSSSRERSSDRKSGYKSSERRSDKSGDGASRSISRRSRPRI